MEIVEVWGYRASAKQRLVPVDVLKIGTRKPPRVQVRFQGEEGEGRVEWVPPARLKVSWGQAAAFEADEARLAEIARASTLHHESLISRRDAQVATVACWSGVGDPGFSVGGLDEDIEHVLAVQMVQIVEEGS